MQRISVDCNTMMQFDDGNRHVVVAQIDHPHDHDLHLCEDERVIVFDDEFQVEAIAHRQGDFWIGEINWSTHKDMAVPLL